MNKLLVRISSYLLWLLLHILLVGGKLRRRSLRLVICHDDRQ